MRIESIATVRTPHLLLCALALAVGLGIACGSPPAADSRSFESMGRADVERRGAYLVHHVTRCLECHSPRDWAAFSGPIVPGAEGLGGQADELAGRPSVPALDRPALEETAVEDLALALRGRPEASARSVHSRPDLANLRELSPVDAHAIAVYLKGSSPARHDPPLPSALRSLERGRYLVALGRCRACHGGDLAGGQEMAIPVTSYPAADISADVETGTGRYTREEFIGFFKSMDPSESGPIPVPEGGRNTAMPWPAFAGMSAEDLGAIYDYLARSEIAPGSDAPTHGSKEID